MYAAPDLPNEAVELEVQDVALLERRGDGEGPIPEVWLRSEELDPHLSSASRRRASAASSAATPSRDEHPLLALAIHRNLRVESTRRWRTSAGAQPRKPGFATRPTAEGDVRAAGLRPFVLTECPPSGNWRSHW